MVELVVWSRATWAERVAAELATRLVERPSLRICLPTGDTPSPVYAALLAAETRGEVSFGEATLVMLDEWVGLPPGDPARPVPATHASCRNTGRRGGKTVGAGP